MEQIRSYALKKFEQVGLSQSEEYRHTPIAKQLSHHFSKEQQATYTPSTPIDIDPFSITKVSESKLVFVNGKFSEALSSWDKTKGVYISTLQKAMATHSHLVAPHFAKHEDDQDPFSLFNTAKWQDGILIHVSKNTIVSKPLIIYYIHDAKNKKVAAHTKLLVVMEPHSKLDLLEKTDSIGAHPVFTTLNEEIVVQKNAILNYCKIQNDKGLSHKISNTYIYQSDASQVTTHVFTLSGKLIRNNLNIQIDGEDCKANLYGLYLVQNEALVDNHTVVDHRKANAYSNELYKGIIGKKAKGVFNGKIYVRQQAQQTNAFQLNKNILFSDTSTLHAKPQLEIWADDVKCSHGCTSGQLDKEAIFYLRSRGLSKSKAQTMLLHAFANETFNSIRDKNLKDIIQHIVSKQLYDDFGL